ncbi:hypothetical protein U1Q18_023925 [Sarracenia purpurea var. burkii]
MGQEVQEDRQRTPLLPSSFASPDDDHDETMELQPHLKRTGNEWTAVAHIITGVMGSGVLSLAWSMAQLGWIAGPLAMLFFASITLAAAFLLSDCYRSPDPDHGPVRNRSYLEAVQVNLGERSAWVCGLVIQIILYGNCIAYTITSAISMRAIQKSNCYHKYRHEAACDYSDTYYMLVFGVAQILMSQIPDFHNMEWLSVVAAIMSLTYSSIGLALGLAKVIGNGVIKGNILGISTSTAAQKMWLVSQALGDIAFAYPYSIILIEIQDTLKSPPPENVTMKKASATAVCITTFFYVCCGGFGYAAFGNSTPGNLLTGFGFYEPYWLIDLANACIVLHLIGGYQLVIEFAKMGRIPCCEKDSVKRGQWTPEEDNKLSSYIAQHGTRNWRLIPKNAGLQRCGKSCRLRWTNYLRPDLKHGQFSDEEEQIIVKVHSVVGNRWSLIAGQLPGRTDNDVKNHWNTKLKKKLSGMGIDPVTHKPFSHLMAEIVTTLAPPQVAHLAEAALGCFKDEMLHLLTKKRVDFQFQQSSPPNTTCNQDEKDDTVEKIKIGLSKAIQEPNMLTSNKPWDSVGTMTTSANFAEACSAFPASVSGFHYSPPSFGNKGDGSPWNQSMCTGSTCMAGDQHGKLVDENGDETEGEKETRNGSSLFNSECVLWDLPSDNLMNPIV